MGDNSFGRDYLLLFQLDVFKSNNIYASYMKPFVPQPCFYLYNLCTVGVSYK